MGDNTLFGKLPDYSIVDGIPRPIKCIILHTPSECTINDNFSVDSNISDYCSVIIPVDNNIKQYLMKGGNCDIRNCTSKTFDYEHNLYSREKLELMNEK